MAAPLALVTGGGYPPHLDETWRLEPTMTIRWLWSRSTEKGPSMTFYDLIEACGDEGCPVCRLGREAAFDSLGAIIYESINDPGVRETLRRSWGFCPPHAQMLTAVENPAGGVAIMYGDFLRHVRDRFRQAADEADRLAVSSGAGGRWRRRAPPKGLATREGLCLACRAEREAERRALAALLDHFDDPRLRDAYAGSAGLCLPHIETAWRQGVGHARLGALLRDAEERAGRLGVELAEFVRKLDYRFKDEPKGGEQTAWSRVLDWFAGSRPRPEGRLARLKRHMRAGSGADGGPVR